MTTTSQTSSESDITDEPAGAARPRPAWWVKLIAFGACLLTLWHVGASFLWIAPYSALREIPTQEVLAGYMLPMFGQSWSVFAPEPINGDYHFNVRAVIEKDGEQIETGWVSATDVELSMIRYNLFPPRAGIQSSEVASGQMNAYNKLNEQQQAVVALDYTEDGWEEWMVRSFDELEGDNPSTAAYMAEEHLSTAYATQVAYAIWGADAVVEVQYRVSRQNVVPYAERNDPGAQRPDPTFSTTGWRLPIEEEGQSRENFANTFRSQFERTQK
ncbi:DUF5819 family protein [Microbacterium hydrocarbonoxydans]|uniref:DUF5819 family protein n=1 Tax=Microbacterium hydrocarbonoxydans TaxID=273678 RepID=UPI00203AAB64|nr:DUF5819 family protein [Microbacterium hydrocarbonoxydans]MCM3778162.1 DUF5819 family protein [Microbacterium hydrocarbonoxydans]